MHLIAFKYWWALYLVKREYRKINGVSENKDENIEITVNDADEIRNEILAKFIMGR